MDPNEKEANKERRALKEIYEFLDQMEMPGVEELFGDESGDDYEDVRLAVAGRTLADAFQNLWLEYANLGLRIDQLARFRLKGDKDGAVTRRNEIVAQARFIQTLRKQLRKLRESHDVKLVKHRETPKNLSEVVGDE